MLRIPVRSFFAALAVSVAACTVVAWPSTSALSADSARSTQPVLAATAPGSAPVLVRPVRYVRPRPSHLSMSPHAIGRRFAAARGWTGHEWTCLDLLWTRESGWQVHNRNRSSGAYGIPQSLPAEKMATAGSNWRDSAVTQIRWGLSYIGATYGHPCGAWAHSQDHGYY